MRVAVVTESFLPHVNGVSGSVQRVCEEVRRRGHEPLVVAPGPGPTLWRGVPVVRVPSVPLPGYPQVRLAGLWPRLTSVLSAFQPDVVHLASPALLGAHAAAVARRLALPVVAVYQTDLAGFAVRYHLGVAERALWRWLRRVHADADRTLAPSRHAVEQLRRHGVERVERWARGVDLRRFAPGHRDDALRRAWSPDGRPVVGYVGRLAPEKQLGLLAPLAAHPGVRLVVVGDGPARRQLERRLAGALFVGHLGGRELSRAYASLDLFVHAGTHETFCQAAQEALASGVPALVPAAGGLLDVVEHGVNGLHVAPDDPAALTDGVEELLRDPERWAALARAARPSVQDRTWERLGDELVGHYAAVARP